ncbi:F-box-like protein [Ceratobasidium sp. AG-Ba]|nr:F-box-like protein [Ceratobasidium sp. AG-Ba]
MPPASANSLPSEILATIFALSRIYCACDYGFWSHDLTATCVRWRRIALSAPGLWTHLDITPQTPSHFIKRLIRRAGGHLLHAHVCEPTPGSGITRPSVEELAEIKILLITYVQCFRTLDITSQDSPKELANAVFEPWLNCYTNIPRALIMQYRPSNRMKASLFPPHYPCNSFLGGEEAISSLTLYKLHLRAIVFDRCLASCCNLVDLQLELPFPSSATTSASRFFAAVSASPMISILKLKGLALEISNFHATPLQLSHLKILSLFNIPVDSLKMLLPLLSLTAPGTEFAITQFDLDAVSSELSDFFARSRVATLYFYPEKVKKFVFWPPLLGLCTYLSLLVLVGVCLNDETTSPLPLATSAGEFTIIFVSCTVETKAILHILNTKLISGLRLEMCSTDNPTELNQDLSQMRTIFLKSHPGLECTISSEDSTTGLSCRNMFDT